MKINVSQSEAPFQSLSTIRRSKTEALQYKQQIECNRIINDNHNINKTHEKHPKITDLRGGLQTADHCGAALFFELNSLKYAFCSTNHLEFHEILYRIPLRSIFLNSIEVYRMHIEFI